MFHLVWLWLVWELLGFFPYKHKQHTLEYKILLKWASLIRYVLEQHHWRTWQRELCSGKRLQVKYSRLREIQLIMWMTGSVNQFRAIEPEVGVLGRVRLVEAVCNIDVEDNILIDGKCVVPPLIFQVLCHLQISIQMFCNSRKIENAAEMFSSIQSKH